MLKRQKKIKSKHYKNRKPGEDKITDDSFNMEMMALMQKQEAAKAAMEENNNTFAKGGNLPKYQNGSYIPGQPIQNAYNPRRWADNTAIVDDRLTFDVNNMFGANNSPTGDLSMAPKTFESQLPELNMELKQPQEVGNSIGKFAPTANILAPLLTVGANAIGSSILAKNATKRKNDLLKDIDINLGRVNPQQIDLSRERANIKADQALSEASGRYMARNARSASEAARIANMARLGSQRISGDLLSRSLQTEEMQNADLRSRAGEMNRQLAAQERMGEQQQRMNIEQMYGDANPQIWANFAQTTGQSLSNYINENQRMRRDYDFMQMAQPNLTMDYQKNFESLTPTQRVLARFGMKNVKPSVYARP